MPILNLALCNHTVSLDPDTPPFLLNVLHGKSGAQEVRDAIKTYNDDLPVAIAWVKDFEARQAQNNSDEDAGHLSIDESDGVAGNDADKDADSANAGQEDD
eukprot:9236898-Ditylum_brightwellii.AAC.1